MRAEIKNQERNKCGYIANFLRASLNIFLDF